MAGKIGMIEKELSSNLPGLTSLDVMSM